MITVDTMLTDATKLWWANHLARGGSESDNFWECQHIECRRIANIVSSLQQLQYNYTTVGVDEPIVSPPPTPVRQLPSTEWLAATDSEGDSEYIRKTEISYIKIYEDRVVVILAAPNVYFNFYGENRQKVLDQLYA